MCLRGATIAVAIVSSLTLSHMAGGATIEEAWRAEAGKARDLRGDPRALRPLHRLADTAVVANDAAAIAGALEELAGLDGWDPNVRSVLLDLIRVEHLDRGATEPARAITRELGTLTSVLYLGPFPNRDRLGHGVIYPPEETIALDGEVAGSTGLLTWRPMEAGHDGVFTLDQANFPFQQVTGYLLAQVKVSGDTAAALRFGADDQVKVWLNGYPLFTSADIHPVRFDQHVVGLNLDDGWNRLLFKVSQDQGPWHFTARLTYPDGAPLDTFQAAGSLESSRAAAAAFEAAPPPERPSPAVTDPRRWLEDRAAARPEDPAAQADLAFHLTMTHPFDRSVQPDAEYARRAVELAPDRADLCLVLHDALSDLEERRQILEQGLGRVPGDSRLRFLLATQHRNRGREERALEELDRLLAGDPDFAVARAIRLAILATLEMPGPSLAGLERLARKHPDAALVRYHLGALHMRHGRDVRAEEELQRYRRHVARDRTVYRDLIILLGRSGDTEPLADLHREIIMLEPTWLTPRLSLTRLLAGTGRRVEALETLDAALVLCPGQPELLRFRAENLILLGREEEALEDLRQALRSRPQDEDLQERLDMLAGGREGFEEVYTLDLKALRERTRQAAVTDSGARCLVDTTVLHFFPGGSSATFRQQVFLVQQAGEAGDLGAFRVLHNPHAERLRIKEARLVRADGTILRATQRDTPYLADPEVRLYYDTRARMIHYPGLRDGDLIELTYVLQDRGEGRRPGNTPGHAILLAGPYPRDEVTVVVETTGEQHPEYHIHGLPSPPAPEESREDDTNRLVFRFGPLPALPAEPGAPAPAEGNPLLVLSGFDDWNDLARWYGHLIRDALEPDEEIRRTVEALTAGLEDERARAEAIYQWVIDRTRYVGLEFGINRIKPYRVGRTYRRLHGDCKDKAALMVAMLEEAGLDGRMALVRTRQAGRVPTDLPTLALFDHVLVTIPSLGLWLDGTVLSHGPAELPWLDQAMPSLVIGPDGGALTETPGPDPTRNRIRWSTETFLTSGAGRVRLRGSLEASGEPAAQMRARFRGSPDPEGALRALLQDRIPGAEVHSLHLGPVELTEPRPSLEFQASIPDPSILERGRRSLPPLLDVPLWGRRLSLGDRTTDLVLGPPVTEEWHQVWRLPPGTHPLQLPEPVRLDSPFGSLTVDMRRDGGDDPEDPGDTVIVDVRRTLRIDQVAATEMDAFRRFCREADAALSRHISLEVEP